MTDFFFYRLGHPSLIEIFLSGGGTV